MAKIKQINNLIIKFNRTYNKYQIIAPNKKILEEFDELKEAEEYAKSVKDFKKIQKKNKITNIDKLCNMINEKYGVTKNEIGSIEHYQDMCTNSIEQIANEYRGTIQLVSGENKELIKYLQGVLEDKIKLKIIK